MNHSHDEEKLNLKAHYNTTFKMCIRMSSLNCIQNCEAPLLGSQNIGAP